MSSTIRASVPIQAAVPKSGSAFFSNQLFGIVLSILVIFSASLSYYYYWAIESTPSSPSPIHELSQAVSKVKQVKRVQWDPNVSLLEYIRVHPFEPVVFYNTQAELWPARRIWKPKYLQQTMEVEDFILKGAFKNINPVFGPYFDKSRPMNSIKPYTAANGQRRSLQRINEYQLWDADPVTFYKAFTSPITSKYQFYFTTNLNLIPDILLSDLHPIDKVLELDPSSKQTNMNFWAGPKGVVAACHYDAYDNVNVQVFGKKKWILFSPTDHKSLYLFPFLHGHHAQAQVNVSLSSDADNELNSLQLLHYPEYTAATRFEAITMPGEVLFLPAMWFHQVETLENSINVNSWTLTTTSKSMETLASTLPAEIFQLDKVKAAQSAQLYLKMLLDELDIDVSFVKTQLYAPRFQPLIRDGQLDPFFGVGNVQQFCLDKPNHQAPSLRSSLQSPSWETIIQKHAVLIENIPSSTLEIWLGNHIELVLFTATQDSLLVAGILHTCYW